MIPVMRVHVETPVGSATLATLKALVDRIDAAAAADPDIRVIVDQTNFDYSSMDADAVREMAVYWETRPHAIHLRHIAIVAPDSPAYGLTRMGVTLADANFNAHTFRTLHEAEAWLTE